MVIRHLVSRYHQRAAGFLRRHLSLLCHLHLMNHLTSDIHLHLARSFRLFAPHISLSLSHPPSLSNFPLLNSLFAAPRIVAF